MPDRSPRKYRSPTARPLSFVWTRRIVLTLMAIFAALPVYVMISTSLKPLMVEGSVQLRPPALQLRPCELVSEQ